MKKNIKNLGLIILVLGLLYMILIPIMKPTETFNKIDLKKENVILNQTNKPYLDTIIHVGLNHLNIKGVTILVKNLENSHQVKTNKDLILEAFIIGDGKQFIIFIDDFNRLKSIIVLSHELIHLQQFYDKKIINLGDDMVWNNILYTDEEIEKIYYFNRPWEKEAFDNQDELNKKIKKDLY